MASRRRRKTDRPVPQLSRGRTPEQVLFDDAVEHAIEMRRMARTEAARLGRIWTDLADPISDALVGRLERLKARGYVRPWQTKAYRDALDRTRELVSDAQKVFLAELTELVVTAARIETLWAAESLKGVLSVLNPDIAFKLPPMNVIRGAALAPTEGLTLVKWSKGLEDSTRKSIERIVNRGLIQGKTLPATTREIRRALELPKRQAETLARTATKHATSAAKEALYQTQSDIIIGVVWVATLDSRTTDICASLDGRTFPLGEGIRPPAHMNCRSEISPLMRDVVDIVSGDMDKPVTQEMRDEAAARRVGKRAAFDYNTKRNAPVPVKVTYPQWLKSQPAAIQDRVLQGPARGKLFRQGKLTIDQFRDSDMRWLRLDELRARYGV